MREPERRQGTFRRNDRRLRNGRSKKRVGLESQFHAPDIVGRRNRCFCNHFLRTHLRNRLSEDPFARCRKTKCGKKHDKQQNDPFHSTLFHSVAANIKKGTGRAKRKPKFSWEVMPNRILTHQSRNGFGGIPNNTPDYWETCRVAPKKIKKAERALPRRIRPRNRDEKSTARHSPERSHSPHISSSAHAATPLSATFGTVCFYSRLSLSL